MKKKICLCGALLLLPLVLGGCGGIQITIKDEGKPAATAEEPTSPVNASHTEAAASVDPAKTVKSASPAVSANPVSKLTNQKEPEVQKPVIEASYSVEESTAEQAVDYLRPTTSQINVRVAPSIDSRSVGILYEDQEALYMHRKNFDPTDGRTWYQAQLQDGSIGWVSSKVVKQSDGRYYSGAVDYSAQSEYLTVIVDQANMRSYPSIDASPAAVVYLNDRLEYWGESIYDSTDGRTWYEVWSPSGTYGWISGKVIR
ncbi:SH3 domain-containing protein [Saccharibacillus qingshengii]|uniref:SH3 domain-containing protein n=1 Tax=Saccharibacillus qingshengii TaxID=1763540 RepID=UPI00155620D6|nr:SH3 domain-containing protein [Saccharibacillus qingshengii]